jgi:acyl-coenzyme A thioesterase PaaI-like protein
MGLSCGLAFGHVPLVTVNLTLDFIAAAKQGEWLEVRPKVVRTGSTLCFATAEIFSAG